MATDPLKRDPTRTITLRKKFIADMNRRFSNVSKLTAEQIRELFGRRYQFISNPDKILSFQKWFQDQVNKGILEVDPIFADRPWTAPYVRSAYKSAVVRSYNDTRKQIPGEDEFYEGGKSEFLKQAFDSPTATSQIRMLNIRAFDQLKGVTADMDKKISIVMSDAMAHGWGAAKTARALRKDVVEFGRVRAHRVARTELIHVYAEGQLDSFERMGVEEVGIMVEWLTAGDACPLCEAQSGQILKVEEARGLIPFHPNCRCAWAPYVESFKAAELVKKAKAAAAKRENTLVG